MSGAGYFGEYSLNFKYYLVDLSQIKNDDILNTNKLIDNTLALDKNRKSEKLTDILDTVIERMERLDEDDRVSFQKWLENVLLASTRGTNQKTVRAIIEMIRSGKGGSKMIHGIQMIIQGEYNRGIADGEMKGKSKTLINLVCKKLRKGKAPEAIAEELEEDIDVLSRIIETAQKYAPDYDEELIYRELAGDVASES